MLKPGTFLLTPRFWANTVMAVVGTALGLLVLVKGYDIFLWQRALRGENGESLRREHEEGARPMQQMQWYPYTGAHIQSNKYYFGPIPLENADFYKEFEYRSGDHGFFVDIDLEHPPAKEPNELRIILIGGSAAQGWGAHKIDEMVYRLLEKKLTGTLHSAGISVRVINLAMAGSITYQNFVALNKWGHLLQPDLILSYSGGNDLLVPQDARSDAPQAWHVVQSFVASLQYNQGSPVVARWEQWLPGLVRFTQLGSILRTIYLSDTSELARVKYSAERNLGEGDPVRDIAIPEYIHAFKSIKRDFDGIPIMIAFQPIDFRMVPDAQQMDPEYRQLIATSIEQLGGYKNDKWYFVNLHDYWKQNGLFKVANLGNGLHLTSELQERVADVLTNELALAVGEMMKSRETSQ